ncbi:hypothetical protein COF47_22860 [Bacillus wiedmannii]|uniref:hypothetical protein n=1 Tax=Bacillus wiedmannii TaxID=1890302 RepID=UPI000BFB6A3C|nr:hypothetical protein [Bacillus wiedmannii]PHE73275.1 hypothetical protein COF47_22860 [Bacillus wiedmannii]
MGEFILPLVLLGLSFFLKLYVNREVSNPTLLSAIAELPVDVMFVSVAFTISYQVQFSNHVITTVNSGTKEILDTMDLYGGYVLFGTYILLTVIVIGFWRLSIKSLDNTKWIWFGFYVGINFIICILSLLNTFSKLSEVL